MATFAFYLDRRNSKGKSKHPLTVRVVEKKHVTYLRLPEVELTEKEFATLFGKKTVNAETEASRKSLEKYLDRARQVYLSLDPYDPSKFRENFYNKKFDPNKVYTPKKGITDDLQSLFNSYMHSRTSLGKLSTSTVTLYKYSLRAILKFNPGATYQDLTPEFLAKFERHFLSQRNNKGETNSIASLGSILRSVRSVLNYHRKKKNIPSSYEYPFIDYVIPNSSPAKRVISDKEIQKIVNMKRFDTRWDETARDIWLLLYRMNGINFIDLLKLRWTDIKGKYITFYRHKTMRTRVYNVRQVKIYITPKIEGLLTKHGVNSSPFVMGFIKKEGYDDHYLMNINQRMKVKINKSLRKIGEQLKLSVSLDISMARDAYANTMKRGGKPIELIAEQMNHANITTTQRHYLDNFDDDTLDNANDVIL